MVLVPHSKGSTANYSHSHPVDDRQRIAYVEDRADLRPRVLVMPPWHPMVGVYKRLASEGTIALRIPRPDG